MGEPVDRCVQRLAEQKALQVCGRLRGPGLPVLGADTAVVICAVALAQRGTLASRLSRSIVRFRPLSPQECEAYWDSGEPLDKAGGYAIQGRAAVFIESLRGSYSGVMGLPLFETAALLRAAGVPVWQA